MLNTIKLVVIIDLKIQTDNVVTNMEEFKNAVLIIATSARMLTQFAKVCDFSPFVIDCCGDIDTQALATIFIKTASLQRDDLYPVITLFQQQYFTMPLIYGSGFEQYPESLIFLAQHFTILGNNSNTFIALQNKIAFFQKLTQLKIPYPPVRFNLPRNTKGWLIKPYASYGGIGIQLLDKLEINHCSGQNYYQQYIPGKVYSALFIANGQQAQLIGFNQQWTQRINQQPFVFAGVINHSDLTRQQQQQLISWINQLTLHYQLRGINGVDFIVKDKQMYLLEINPRPPASLQLYDAPLFTAHYLACTENKIDFSVKMQRFKAYQIIYAKTDCTISPELQWSNNYMDRPPAGTRIRKGQPLCSLLLSGQHPERLLRDLRFQKHFFLNHLDKTLEND